MLYWPQDPLSNDYDREWSSGMRSSRFTNVQIEDGIGKHDANLLEYRLSTAEALSRWENDGGAPDRREETGKSRIPDAPQMLQIRRPAQSVTGRHLGGSTIDPKR